MKKRFENYLVDKGYKVTTPSGKPSTVHAYLYRVDKVCEWENMTWLELAESITEVVSQYDVGGSKEDLGKISHCSVINSLRRFEEFTKTE